MADLRFRISIITLNVNNLIISIKWWQLIKQIKKTRLNYILFTGNYKFNDIGRLKVKGQKNIYHANSNQRRAEQVHRHQTKQVSEQRKLLKTNKDERINPQEGIIILNMPNNSLKIHEAKAERAERRTNQTHNYS